MAKTDAQIQTILTNTAELTDTETLALYRQVRDQILAKTFDDEHPKTITIRGRTVEMPDPVEMLKFIEEMIRYYTRLVSSTSSGIARTYARITRPSS